LFEFVENWSTGFRTSTVTMATLQEEREVFWQQAKPVILNVPEFAQTASEDDATKVILNNEIEKLQNDPNSIYSCK
jgi:hypothetical protein